MASQEKSFEEILAESTKRGANIVPGCVLAAIDRNGEIFYNESSGYRSCAPDAPPIDPNGTFWIASCTKLITSICALQCVERGLVTLDEDVSSILPELKDPQIVELDDKAEHGYTLRPAKGFVTLRQLITHTSGVGYGFLSEAITKWREHVGPPMEELKGKVTEAFTAPLLFEPGQGWAYGGGLDWAGIMVVRLTGSKTLGNYMEEHIFKPLGGMPSTTFDMDTRPDIEERLVQTSRREEDGTLVVHDQPVFLLKVHEHSGGGGLWSSVPDYIKVLGDLLKDEPKLLKKETVEQHVLQPQIKPGNPGLDQLVNARMATSANAVAADDAGLNYGLGGLLLTKDAEATGLPAGSLSWGGLPNLKWFVHRGLGVAGMYASQVLPPGDPPSIELSSAFSKEIIRLAKQRQTNEVNGATKGVTNGA